MFVAMSGPSKFGIWSIHESSALDAWEIPLGVCEDSTSWRKNNQPVHFFVARSKSTKPSRFYSDKFVFDQEFKSRLRLKPSIERLVMKELCSRQPTLWAG